MWCSFFSAILEHGALPAACREVRLHQDGSWSVVEEQEEAAALEVSPAPPLRAPSLPRRSVSQQYQQQQYQQQQYQTYQQPDATSDGSRLSISGPRSNRSDEMSASTTVRISAHRPFFTRFSMHFHIIISYSWPEYVSASPTSS